MRCAHEAAAPAAPRARGQGETAAWPRACAAAQCLNMRRLSTCSQRQLPTAHRPLPIARCALPTARCQHTYYCAAAAPCAALLRLQRRCPLPRLSPVRPAIAPQPPPATSHLRAPNGGFDLGWTHRGSYLQPLRPPPARNSLPPGPLSNLCARPPPPPLLLPHVRASRARAPLNPPLLGDASLLPSQLHCCAPGCGARPEAFAERPAATVPTRCLVSPRAAAPAPPATAPPPPTLPQHAPCTLLSSTCSANGTPLPHAGPALARGNPGMQV
jgi:hypothetical protein